MHSMKLAFILIKSENLWKFSDLNFKNSFQYGIICLLKKPVVVTLKNLSFICVNIWPSKLTLFIHGYLTCLTFFWAE